MESTELAELVVQRFGEGASVVSLLLLFCAWGRIELIFVFVLLAVKFPCVEGDAGAASSTVNHASLAKRVAVNEWVHTRVCSQAVSACSHSSHLPTFVGVKPGNRCSWDVRRRCNPCAEDP